MRLHSLPSYLYQFRLLAGLRFYLADLCRAILDPHSRIAYAQWGEDLALQHLLGTQPGFYVEVGANHPRFFRTSSSFIGEGGTASASKPTSRSFGHTADVVHGIRSYVPSSLAKKRRLHLRNSRIHSCHLLIQPLSRTCKNI